jgi:uncharacterized repeat protein (TIGR01451 family)
VITDTFSRPVTVLSTRRVADACTRRPPSCRIDSLAAGAQAEITVIARAGRPGTLINSASVTAANDPRGAAARASVTVVQARTSLSLRNRVSRAHVRASGRLSYRVTVRNTGANPAVAVRVCARLPHGLTFASAPGARIHGQTACWSLARLSGHGSRSFTIHARADNVRRRTRITIRATAKGSNTTSAARRVNVTIDPGAAPRPGGVTG